MLLSVHMDGQVVAGVIGAAGGVVIALVGSVLSHKRLSRKFQDSSMSSNYQKLFEELRSDVSRLRDEQAEERKQWADERKDFNAKIGKLQEQLRSQDKAVQAKEVEVAELRGEVRALTVQLETYRAAAIKAVA